MQAEAIATHTDAGRPLRIALLGYRSNPYGGGQGIYLNYLSKALVDQGHRVDVISGPPYPHLDERVKLIKIPSLDLYENGLRSVRAKHLRSMSNIIEWTSKLTGGFAEPYTFGRRVVKYLREHGQQYDVIHDNQSLCYGLLKLQKRFPLAVTIHHPVTSDFELAMNACDKWYEKLMVRRWYSFLRMQKRVAKRLKHVVTVSETSKQDIIEAFAVAPHSLSLVYNGIPTDVFKPMPEVERKPFRIMTTTSADQPLKGLRYLLEAVALVRPQFPEIELLVIGKPREGGETEQQLNELKLWDCVRFVKGIPTEELVRYYAEATVAVSPSLYEGFGLPAGEAMACGVPIVSSDGGALPEVVGDAGIVVPAGNSEALAEGIARLLRDPAERARLADAGRRRILEKFSWEVAAGEMVAFYRSVIEHANG